MGRRKKDDIPGSLIGFITFLAIIGTLVTIFPPVIYLILGLLLIGFILYISKTISNIKMRHRFKMLYNNVSESLIKIDQMDGQTFEDILIEEILPANGYSDIKGTVYTGDYGVDIMAFKNGSKFAIQCKRSNGAVGNSAIQEVVAGMKHYNCTQAMVITNNYYTKNQIDNKLKLKFWLI